jgi:hypothetical protein
LRDEWSWIRGENMMAEYEILGRFEGDEKNEDIDG